MYAYIYVCLENEERTGVLKDGWMKVYNLLNVCVLWVNRFTFDLMHLFQNIYIFLEIMFIQDKVRTPDWDDPAFCWVLVLFSQNLDKERARGTVLFQPYLDDRSCVMAIYLSIVVT